MAVLELAKGREGDCWLFDLGLCAPLLSCHQGKAFLLFWPLLQRACSFGVKIGVVGW